MVFKVFFMFHFVLFSWLLFRVPDMATFISYTGGLANLTLGSQLSSLVYVLIAAIGLVHFTPRSWLHEKVFGVFERGHFVFQAGCFCALFFVFIGASINSGAFIYFQF
ncbi:hypothetical protein A3760_31680 [Oleiphilus sp. HI0122]|nr:hypothetical protein A3760_31680 [Oleiphilus sp. HI0122]